MNNLSQKQTENSEAKIRFRCPSCSKLFSSNPNAIFVEKPQYKCTSCKTDFYIVLKDALNSSEVVGYDFVAEAKPLPQPEMSDLIKSPEPKVKLEDVDWSIIEDDVDFKSTELLEDPLESSWSLIVKSYQDKKLHQNFIKLAQTHDRIDFAKKKYGEILKANPFDEVARSCFNLIEIKEQTEIMLSKELDKTHVKTSMWSAIVLTLGVLLIFLGLFVFPEFQRLSGLGLGLVVFTFALKSLFQKSQAPY
jgi:hypothetical protein